MSGLPGQRGIEHVGLTVPDLDAATRFFVEALGCTVAYEIGPFASDDDWMERQLGVPPRAVLRRLRMLRCANGANLELFHYEVEGQATRPPGNADHFGHHLAFQVDDIDAALAHLRAHGAEVQGEVVTMTEGPSEGLRWVYARAPWGLQLELVSAPRDQAITRERPDALWAPA